LQALCDVRDHWIRTREDAVAAGDYDQADGAERMVDRYGALITQELERMADTILADIRAGGT
jgi:hypothetical protein